MPEYIAIKRRGFLDFAYWDVSYSSWLDVAKKFGLDIPEGCTEEQAANMCFDDPDFPARMSAKTKKGLHDLAKSYLEDGTIKDTEYTAILEGLRWARR